GRNGAGGGGRVRCTATAPVPLIAPMTMFEPRRSQVDFRLAKVLNLRRGVRLQANFDVYNLLNDSSVLGLNATYGSQWLLPIVVVSGTESILPGRLGQFGGPITVSDSPVPPPRPRFTGRLLPPPSTRAATDGCAPHSATHRTS